MNSICILVNNSKLKLLQTAHVQCYLTGCSNGRKQIPQKSRQIVFLKCQAEFQNYHVFLPVSNWPISCLPGVIFSRLFYCQLSVWSLFCTVIVIIWHSELLEYYDFNWKLIFTIFNTTFCIARYWRTIINQCVKLQGWRIVIVVIVILIVPGGKQSQILLCRLRTKSTL